MKLEKIIHFILGTICALFILVTSCFSEKKDKRAEIVIDVETGRILHSYKSDHIRHPASLTKLMTLFMMFEKIDSGKLSPQDKIKFSKYAAGKPPSKLGIKAGKSITVKDAAYTLIIRSANDVAAAVAEKLGGSESNFAKMMTRKARQIGMTRTVFHNASGLPDVKQVTTAKDMAVLALRLMQQFPHYYKYFSTKHKKVAGKTLRTHNHLLKHYKGMDGMKTGYVAMSGWNLVSSAERNNKRLLTVVMGGTSAKQRDKRVALLTNIGWKRLEKPYGYSQFIGTGVRQLASLKTDFKPLETDYASNIKTASIVPGLRRDGSVVQKLIPDQLLSQSAQYKLNHVAQPKKGGWQHRTASLNRLPQAPAEIDEIARLINNNNSFYKRSRNASLFTDSVQELLASGELNDTHISQKDEWMIQVGAFSKKSVADNYLNGLARKYNRLSKAHPELIAVKRDGDYIYRARFSGFTPSKAKAACQELKASGKHCILANAS